MKKYVLVLLIILYCTSSCSNVSMQNLENKQISNTKEFGEAESDTYQSEAADKTYSSALDEFPFNQYPGLFELNLPNTIITAPNGNIYLEIKVDYISEFYDGYAYLETRDWKGYINEKFQKILTLSQGIYCKRFPLPEGISYTQFLLLNNTNSKQYFKDYKERTASVFHEGLTVIAKKVGDFHYKYGYMDKMGEIIINYQFDYAGDFSDGMAIVGKLTENGMRCGYIDKNGKLVIDYQYEAAGDFKNGIANVITPVGEEPEIINTYYSYDYYNYDKNSFFIDKKGMPIVTEDYFLCDYFSYGLGQVFANTGTKAEPEHRYGFIDLNGNIVIPPIYEDINTFSEGLAWGNINNLVNTEGERIAREVHYPIVRGFSEGLATTTYPDTIYMDRNGQLAFDKKFWAAYDFSEGLACVADGEDGVAYIDKSGDIVIPSKKTKWVKGLSFAASKFHKALEFSEGLAVFYYSDEYGDYEKWGLMDKEGREVFATRFAYDNPPKFKNGMAVTEVIINDNMQTTAYRPVLLKYAGNIHHKPINFQVNGQQVNDVIPQIFNDVLMLPIDEVSQLLQLDVHYDTVNNQYTIKKGVDTLIHEFNKTVFFINDEFYLMDAAPSLRLDGQNLLPVYYIEELTGYEIKWDSENFKLEINM